MTNIYLLKKKKNFRPKIAHQLSNGAMCTDRWAAAGRRWFPLDNGVLLENVYVIIISYTTDYNWQETKVKKKFGLTIFLDR